MGLDEKAFKHWMDTVALTLTEIRDEMRAVRELLEEEDDLDDDDEEDDPEDPTPGGFFADLGRAVAETAAGHVRPPRRRPR